MNVNSVYLGEIIEDKFEYDSFTGTYWIADQGTGESIEFTEDELIEEGIYLNEYCQQI
jgi:hypothetical protein